MKTAAKIVKIVLIGLFTVVVLVIALTAAVSTDYVLGVHPAYYPTTQVRLLSYLVEIVATSTAFGFPIVFGWLLFRSPEKKKKKGKKGKK